MGETFEDINKFELKNNKSNYVADKIENSDEKNIQGKEQVNQVEILYKAERVIEKLDETLEKHKQTIC